MQETLKPKVNDDFIAETFENEVLLYTTTDTKAIYLNDTAHVVWLLCKENLNVGEIIAALSEQYPDQKDQIKHDVISALKFLIKNKAIILTDEES